MKKINLGLIGASGKMGTAIRDCLKGSQFIPFVAISSKECPDFKHQFKTTTEIPKKVSEKVDVWIEFSSIEKLLNFLKESKSEKIKIVSGTTGLSNAEFKKLKSFSKKSALFWSGVWTISNGYCFSL